MDPEFEGTFYDPQTSQRSWAATNQLTGALPGFLLCCYVTRPAHLSSLHVLVYASLVTEKARCFGKLFGCCQDAS